METKIRSVAVYCGSNPGTEAAYAEAAIALGKALAKENWKLVYGGGNTGLMGTVANATLEAGGQAIGVMPELLIEKEIAHPGLTELHSVSSMHERKKMMIDLADAFVALPGGIGTLEEIAEALTWLQLGIHQKPCALLNTQGFYDHLISFLDNMLEKRFLKESQRSSLIVEQTPEQLIQTLKDWTSTYEPKWLDRT